MERIGPLLATFTAADPNPFLNYAIPDEDAEPTDEVVALLIERARAHGRRPRLEYLPELAPAVELPLLEAGFEIEGRLPLMVSGVSELTEPPTPPSIELVAPSTDLEYDSAALAQFEAFGGSGAAPEHVAAALRRTAGSGGLVALARDAESGEAAGSGLVTAPSEGVAELAAVAVRPAFRRRGIAAALTARLTREARATGTACVFLMAAGESQARIYARAGYTTTTEVLHLSRD